MTTSKRPFDEDGAVSFVKSSIRNVLASFPMPTQVEECQTLDELEAECGALWDAPLDRDNPRSEGQYRSAMKTGRDTARKKMEERSTHERIYG